MNSQLQALKQRVVEQAVTNPNLLGDELTFESNAAEPIPFNGVLQLRSRKSVNSDEGAFDQCDATLLMTLADYQSLKAAVSDFNDDGWVTYQSQRFYFIGETDNTGVTIVAILSVNQSSALGRTYPRTAGRASHR